MVKDIKLYLSIAVVLILMVGIIVSNIRVSKLNSKCKKLQKHLIYHMKILIMNIILGKNQQNQKYQKVTGN